MNNNSMRLLLLPPRAICIVFVFKAKVREFFIVESKKRVAGFRDGSLRRYQAMTNDSMAFVLKILCFEKL